MPTLLLLLAIGASTAARADTYNLVIQPILPPEETKAAYQHLADYLSKQTGQTIKLVTAINFTTYWQTMKKNKEYDLIMDAAHFTDYRIKKMGFTVLAKIPDVVGYSLVSRDDNPILDPEELIGKRVATIGSPSLGAVRLEQMYPNPLRQPVILEVNDTIDSIRKVLDKKAEAAIIPTPLVGRYPLNTIVTTSQVPHIALSASSRVDKAAQDAIRKALLEADRTDEGKAMLKAINFPSFEPTDAKTYNGQAELLEGVWGY